MTISTTPSPKPSDPFAGAKNLSDGGYDPDVPFFGIGESDKQRRQVEGVLEAIEESTVYPGTLNYIFLTAEGRVKVAGNTALKDKIQEIGALYRITYTGKARGKAGKTYKTFEVLFIPNAEAREKGLLARYELAALPKSDDDGSDDLPF
jgi:hypothetical protein